MGWQHVLPPLVGAVATLVFGAAAIPEANAKSPGARYCFHGYCHRVGTLAQTNTLVGWRGYVLASYYDSCRLDRMNPCGLTSSGAVFRPDLPDNAASPLLPDGTVILVFNPKTGDASVLRVTNAGPYSGSRKLDVSRAAAEKLGFQRQGTAALVISVLQSPTLAEASYVRQRVYLSVPGYLGRFANFDPALKAAKERLELRKDGEHQASQAEAFGPVPRPQLAVSPLLARELVMLRTLPRLARRETTPVERPKLIQGPRLVTRNSIGALALSQPASLPMDFASGLRQHLREPSTPDGGQ